MSLIKQLWLAIILIMGLAFGTSFIINIATSKNYLEEQLAMKNTDNAVSLALSISQMEKDPVAVNLMLSAQFDNGHYAYIKLTDPNHQLITERVSEEKEIRVPSWFKQFINISPDPGVAQIQDGWIQYGVLSLSSSTQFAYLDLWNGTKWMLLWSTLIAIVCGMIGTIILKAITRPLLEMVAMTEAIGDKNFISIQEPNTIEFKSLARALNHLSQKIKDMLKDQSNLLEQMRLEANYDELTGLMNRKYFSNRVATYIENEDNFMQGVLVISHICNLTEINEKLGAATTDSVLKRIGLALEGYCKQHSTVIAGRLTGADFAIFSSEPVDHNTLCEKVESLLKEASGLPSQLNNLILKTTVSDIKKSDQLEHLKQLIATIRIKTQSDEVDIMAWIHQEDATVYQSQDESEWRTLITTAIQAKRLKLAAFPVISNDGKVLHYESPARLQLHVKGPWLEAGEFIPWANQLGLVTQLDLLVLEKAIKTLIKDETQTIAVNVSTNAMFAPDYHGRLHRLLSNSPAVAKRLWLEVSENSAFEHLPQLTSFCEVAKALGCQLGVKHVGSQISKLGELHALNLDYIKVDASIVRNIDKNPGNKAFLKGICLIAHSIGLITIAEGVQTEQELSTLPELGIDASTGPIIQ